MICTTSRKTTRRSETWPWATLALTALLGAGIAGGDGRAAAEPGPREAVEQMVEEVLAVLRDSALSQEDRRAVIEAIAYERFDFKTMSKLVLARSWKRFSAEQRDEFMREFKDYLAHSYGDRIDRYEQEEVEIVGQREEPRGDVTVQTRIVGGEHSGTNVDYRLRGRTGRWLVIDVVVEGISLVSNYRDQFREVVNNGGPDHLLVQLREKNASGVATASNGG
jgi:phospholipid transport system substrate-binding protein